MPMIKIRVAAEGIKYFNTESSPPVTRLQYHYYAEWMEDDEELSYYHSGLGRASL